MCKNALISTGQRKRSKVRCVTLSGPHFRGFPSPIRAPARKQRTQLVKRCAIFCLFSKFGAPNFLNLNKILLSTNLQWKRADDQAGMRGKRMITVSDQGSATHGRARRQYE